MTVIDQSDQEELEIALRPDPLAAGAHPARHRVLLAGRIIVFVAVVAGIGYAVTTQWESVRHTVMALSWKSLVSSFAALVLGMFATVQVWRRLLAALGTDVRYRHSAQVMLVGQLAKYVPGTVWAFVLQAQLGRRHGISRTNALVAMLLATGITVVTALTLGALAAAPLSAKWGGSAWLLLLGPLSLITVIPPVLTRIANLALRVLRRGHLSQPLRTPDVLMAVLWSFVSWLLFGAHLWLLAGALASQDFTGYIVTTGAIGLAMSAGFIAFVLPSGIGVREAVLVAGLATLARPGEALAIALVSRLMFTIADVSTALVALVISRLSHQTRAVEVPSPPAQ